MAKPNGFISSSAKSPQRPYLYSMNKGINHYKQSSGHLSMSKVKLFDKGFLPFCGKLTVFVGSSGSSVACRSRRNCNTETKERLSQYDDCSNILSPDSGDEQCAENVKNISFGLGLADACRYVYNDAKFVNDRAKNDIVLLSRYVYNDAKFVNDRAKNDIVLLSRSIMKLDARARQDVAFLGTEFLKLDARAREDTVKIDHGVKRRAERLHHIATILKTEAESKLKSAADKHWSDGALEADLKRADFAAKRRAMEDSLMALEFVKNIHDMMVIKTYRLKQDSEVGSSYITLEKNGKNFDFFPGDVSTDRIDAIEEAYRQMASALSEAGGFDYTDPEELELLVATLIDLDAMDGKSSVSLLAECSNSPDDETRRALANALSVAPSMWTLGNAGMGALQRLADDSNPAIAAAASKTIYELKKQWEIEEGDSWKFMMNQTSTDRDQGPRTGTD